MEYPVVVNLHSDEEVAALIQGMPEDVVVAIEHIRRLWLRSRENSHRREQKLYKRLFMIIYAKAAGIPVDYEDDLQDFPEIESAVNRLT